METFEYIKPKSLEDAVDILNAYDNAQVLAGGTDLLVAMKYNAVRPECILDIKDIPGMNSVEFSDRWQFGALTTIRDIEVSDRLGQAMPFLTQAAQALGSVQIRNRATLGGNLCNASPCSNFGAMFLAMDATLEIMSKNGPARISLADFFLAPNRTALKKGEILSRIILPPKTDGWEGIFLKHSTGKSNDLGLVNIAITLQRDPDNSFCKKINIAMGAVAPTPVRAKKAEALLVHQPLTPERISKAAQQASQEASPITDFRATADYRRSLVTNMVEKGIRSLLHPS